ncbi:MAG: nuclear transport factor 2 family protein [Solirubrobacterales bacterium]|nr:nuclear transport factor 2 family protein [Solirubrobacterales bacterium]
MSVADQPALSVERIAVLVQEWLDAWNSHDEDRVLSFLTDDVDARDDSWPKAMHGHAEVREFLKALWRAVPDMTFELISGPYVIPGEPRASFHWRGSGTFTGVMDPPGFAPTGRHWEIDGADFHEYRDGRIATLRVVFDLMSVSRQLGVMPASGSRAERAMAAAQRGLARAQHAYRRRPT